MVKSPFKKKKKNAPPVIVASNVKKLNIDTTSFKNIEELNNVLNENVNVGKIIEDEYVHYGVNFLEILKHIYKQFFFTGSHPFEIQIGLQMVDLCFQKYNIKCNLNLCSQHIFIETIKFLNKLLKNCDEDLYLASAAANALSRAARWNEDEKVIEAILNAYGF